MAAKYLQHMMMITVVISLANCIEIKSLGNISCQLRANFCHDFPEYSEKKIEMGKLQDGIQNDQTKQEKFVQLTTELCISDFEIFADCMQDSKYSHCDFSQILTAQKSDLRKIVEQAKKYGNSGSVTDMIVICKPVLETAEFTSPMPGQTPSLDAKLLACKHVTSTCTEECKPDISLPIKLNETPANLENNCKALDCFILCIGQECLNISEDAKKSVKKATSNINTGLAILFNVVPVSCHEYSNKFRGGIPGSQGIEITMAKGFPTDAATGNDNLIDTDNNGGSHNWQAHASLAMIFIFLQITCIGKLQFTS